MNFLSLQGATVKDGMMGELQRWLAANEAELRDTAPEGTEYLGAYVTIYNSEKGMGDVVTVMRLDSYGAQDRLAAAHGTRFGELVEGLVAHLDQAAAAPASNLLLKALTDATLWGEG